MKKEKKLSKKELRELLTEQGYTIEALEDEAESLEQECADRRAKLWEVIQENDRLTLRYEPYRPEGDEHGGYDFYELIEENDELTKKVLDKMEIIKEQDGEISKLVNQVYELKRTLQVNSDIIKAPKPKKPRVKNDRWWNCSLELWPGAWGLNYHRYDWKKYGANTREGSFQIGPFGYTWNREPKR